MFELMVMRHAKSDWDSTARNDHDRPLAKRGVKAAAKMGALLASAKRVPTLAISSSATRAQTTATLVLEVMQEHGHTVPKLQIDSELYGATVDGWIRVVGQHFNKALTEKEEQSHFGDHQRVLVAGHEPTCSSVVHFLTGARCRFPTGAVATIRMSAFPNTSILNDASSERHRMVDGVLESFIIPRLL